VQILVCGTSPTGAFVWPGKKDLTSHGPDPA
jgi:hypothetical protein